MILHKEVQGKYKLGLAWRYIAYTRLYGVIRGHIARNELMK